MDQSSATTKMSTVLAFVDFDYWSLYVEVRMGGRPDK